MKAFAVIGANYGDEGKGLITDYLCRQVENPLVIRFNGGAQAGHTVETPEGVRHIHSHFGSGTLAGAPTYLSKHFVVNPILFNREYDVLVEKGIVPKVYVHPDCLVTTPFDMMINQATEKARKGDRHGSCGYGVFETINRNAHQHFTLVEWWKNDFRSCLKLIRDEWLPNRLRELRLNSYNLDPSYKDDALIEKFLDDCWLFLERTRADTLNPERASKRTIIFEGAQGLTLDQNNINDFPYLTPSNTGIRNVLELAENMKVTEIEAHYVSRTYLTRHGPGPLPNERDMELTCQTNKFNEWQGKLRYAPLDIEALLTRVNEDVNKHTHEKIKVYPNISFTHCDVGRIPFVFNHEGGQSINTIEAATIPNRIAENFQGLTSFGPCSTDVRSKICLPKKLLENC